MPETLTYSCQVCGRTVNDSDLKADATGTLRRLIVNAQAFRSLTTVLTPATTQPRNDQWTGDGSTTSWTVAHQVDPGQAIELTVSGTSASVAVVAAGTTPATQYVLAQQTDGSWKLQTGTGAAPAAGALIALAYSSDVPAVTSAAIEENNPGSPLVFCGQAHAAAWAQNWAW